MTRAPRWRIQVKAELQTQEDETARKQTLMHSNLGSHTPAATEINKSKRSTNLTSYILQCILNTWSQSCSLSHIQHTPEERPLWPCSHVYKHFAWFLHPPLGVACRKQDTEWSHVSCKLPALFSHRCESAQLDITQALYWAAGRLKTV